MALAALTVVVVLAGAEPDASSASMDRALHVALGEDTKVLVETREAPDDALIARARGEGAAVVGVVRWLDNRSRATMHFARVDDGRWADREIRFDASDAPAERGRTVGFAIASMFPDAASSTSAQAPPPPPAPTSSAAPASTATSTPPPPPHEEPVAPFAARDRASIEASALVSSGLDGGGGGIGFVVAGRIPLGSALRLRLAAGARFGDVPAAQATSRYVVVSGGVAWQMWLDAPKRWLVGARVEGLVERQELSHLSADDPVPDVQSRWVPGAGAALELGWRFTEQAAVVAAMGPEVLFGRSIVTIRQQSAAEIGRGRFQGEAGLRVSF